MTFRYQFLTIPDKTWAWLGSTKQINIRFNLINQVLETQETTHIQLGPAKSLVQKWYWPRMVSRSEETFFLWRSLQSNARTRRASITSMVLLVLYDKKKREKFHYIYIYIYRKKSFPRWARDAYRTGHGCEVTNRGSLLKVFKKVYATNCRPA